MLEALEERGWLQRELAHRMGYTQKHVSQLVNGKVPITVDAAQRLARVLGSTMDFWLALETNYQIHQARIEDVKRCAAWSDWLDELPVKQLMEKNLIPSRQVTANNRPSIVADCLRYFAVASPDVWRQQYKAGASETLAMAAERRV